MHRSNRIEGGVWRWVCGLMVAALIAVITAASPAAARHHAYQHVSAAPDHKAWAPVNGHQFNLKSKHHRAFHHAIRRYVPDPALVSTDAGVPNPSRLEPITAAADLARACIVQASRPPPTGPPAV